eukprot:446740_1
MGTASCKPSRTSKCCSNTDIDIQVLHNTRATNYNSSYIEINTEAQPTPDLPSVLLPVAPPQATPDPTPVISTQTMELVLGMHNLDKLNVGCSPAADVSTPPLSMRQFPKYIPPTESISTTAHARHQSSFTELPTLPSDVVDDALLVAMGVMTHPDPPSRKQIIDKNRGYADTIHNINSEILYRTDPLGEMAMLNEDSPSSDVSDNTTVILHETEGMMDTISPGKAPVLHAKRSSHLYNPSDTESWRDQDIKQLAHEMRSQMVLLKRKSQSLSVNNVIHHEVFSNESSTDDDDDVSSDDDKSMDSPQPRVRDVNSATNVNEIVSENIRLTQKFQMKQEENEQQIHLIHAQQQQIEALQRMLQQLQVQNPNNM